MPEPRPHLTPRQRIVLRRASESARARGDLALAAELADDYEYAGVQTCAVDGMCQTACPVLINTGSLVKRLRREEAAPVVDAAWRASAAGWGPVTRVGSVALSAAKALPTAVVRAATDVGRAVLGADTVPRYSAELPRGGPSRARLGRLVGSGDDAPIGVYVPACVNSMFGAAGDGPGVTAAFVRLLIEAGLRMIVPDGVESVCCGTPWASKGFAAGARVNEERTIDRIRAAAADSGLKVVSDASSCTEGFAAMLERAGIVVEDAVAFTAREILPRVDIGARIGELVLHPTCSSRQMGLDPDLVTVGRAVADRVHVPDDWGCCAFAGDRGMLHPELTASATAAEAAEVRSLGADAHASCNRTCELGMTRATGTEYRHVLELLADAMGTPRDRLQR